MKTFKLTISTHQEVFIVESKDIYHVHKTAKVMCHNENTKLNKRSKELGFENRVLSIKQTEEIDTGDVT